jgi:hypothetical protein
MQDGLLHLTLFRVNKKNMAACHIPVGSWLVPLVRLSLGSWAETSMVAPWSGWRAVHEVFTSPSPRVVVREIEHQRLLLKYQHGLKLWCSCHEALMLLTPPSWDPSECTCAKSTRCKVNILLLAFVGCAQGDRSRQCGDAPCWQPSDALIGGEEG